MGFLLSAPGSLLKAFRCVPGYPHTFSCLVIWDLNIFVVGFVLWSWCFWSIHTVLVPSVEKFLMLCSFHTGPFSPPPLNPQLPTWCPIICVCIFICMSISTFTSVCLSKAIAISTRTPPWPGASSPLAFNLGLPSPVLAKNPSEPISDQIPHPHPWCLSPWCVFSKNPLTLDM